MGKKLKLGIFGFGVVGQGLYDIIKTKELNLEIKKFVIKHPEKKRSLPQELFHTDPDAILEDEEINTVIELIDDAEVAFDIVSKALRKGKNVVEAEASTTFSFIDRFLLCKKLPKLCTLNFALCTF